MEYQTKLIRTQTYLYILTIKKEDECIDTKRGGIPDKDDPYPYDLNRGDIDRDGIPDD